MPLSEKEKQAILWGMNNTSPNLLYTTTPNSPFGPPTISMGSQGLYVAYCQNLLNVRISQSPVLWVDGIFGTLTNQRVRQFQTMRMLEVDGIVGPQTWAALEAGPPPIKRRPQ